MVWPATQLGFVSRSSIGTLPLTERVTERKPRVPREYASFAVPLGATTKMDGCAAVYPAIAAIFVAQFYGIDLSITDYLLIVVVSVIGSAATAGTTGATVMLDADAVDPRPAARRCGLLLAVEPIVDMGRTALNVTGRRWFRRSSRSGRASSTRSCTTHRARAIRSRTNRSNRPADRGHRTNHNAVVAATIVSGVVASPSLVNVPSSGRHPRPQRRGATASWRANRRR